MCNTFVADITIIPVVEAVNNEFISQGIVKSIMSHTLGRGANYIMPFTRQWFSEAISNEVGVLTNAKTKPGYVQHMISLLVDNRIAVFNRCVTIGPIHQKSYVTPSLQNVLQTMREELYQWRNTDKGPSGKSSSTEDDMSIAFMLNAYWSHYAKMTISMQTRDTTPIETLIPQTDDTQNNKNSRKRGQNNEDDALFNSRAKISRNDTVKIRSPLSHFKISK